MGHGLGPYDLGLGPKMGRVCWACGVWRDGFGAQKNPFIKCVGYRKWIRTLRLGSGINKPSPNPTHCHSLRGEPNNSKRERGKKKKKIWRKQSTGTEQEDEDEGLKNKPTKFLLEVFFKDGQYCLEELIV